MERRALDFKGPKSLDAWIEVYRRRVTEDRDVCFLPDEEFVFFPEFGFFTFVFDLPGRCVIIPKMCGDGRFLRRKVFELVKAVEYLGFRFIRCFSRRPPEVYLRVLGGRLDYVEDRGGAPLYHYVVSLDDTKEAGLCD